MLDGLADAYVEFARDGFAAPARRVRGARRGSTGRDVDRPRRDGRVRARGRVAGVDETGRLVVEGRRRARRGGRRRGHPSRTTSEEERAWARTTARRASDASIDDAIAVYRAGFRTLAVPAACLLLPAGLFLGLAQAVYLQTRDARRSRRRRRTRSRTSRRSAGRTASSPLMAVADAASSALYYFACVLGRRARPLARRPVAPRRLPHGRRCGACPRCSSIGARRRVPRRVSASVPARRPARSSSASTCRWPQPVSGVEGVSSTARSAVRSRSCAGTSGAPSASSLAVGVIVLVARVRDHELRRPCRSIVQQFSGGVDAGSRCRGSAGRCSPGCCRASRSRSPCR